MSGPWPALAPSAPARRCGTSFLMVVMRSRSGCSRRSVRFFIFEPVDANRDDPADRGRFVQEINAAGQKESGAIFKLMTLPGIWLQNLTTREPSDDQLEVTIYALKVAEIGTGGWRLVVGGRPFAPLTPADANNH